jgi:hypothetical protein
METVPIEILKLCEDLCGHETLHAVKLSGGHYKLRCLTCRHERTPAVRHALIHKLGEVCKLPALPPDAVVAPIAVTCHDCRVLTERVYAHFGKARRLCRRCTVVRDHTSYAALMPDGHDRRVVVCDECKARHDEVGPIHLEAKDGANACGLVTGGRVEKTLTRASCPGCLATFKPSPAAEFGAALTLKCAGCRCATAHHVHLLLADAGQRTVVACATCGDRRAGPPILHSAYRGMDGICETHRAGSATSTPESVTCGTCVCALSERVLVPIPDWRPPEHIAEDHYAV